MVEPRRCGTCKHREGDPACQHDFNWSDEIKTTSPPFRSRSCKKCPLRECILVCGPDDDRAHPCGQQDCRYCNPQVMKEEREYWKRVNPSGIFMSAEVAEMFRKSKGQRNG